MPTRRDFLGSSGLVVLTAGVLGSGGLLAGCGGGGGGSKSFVQTSGGDSVGTETAGRAVGDPLYPIFVAKEYEGRSAIFFGPRDSSGGPKSLHQSVHWEGSSTDKAIRVLYDSAGYPAQLVDEASGAFLALFWNTSAGTVDVQSYNSAAVYQGGVRATIVSGAVTSVTALAGEPTRAVPAPSSTGAAQGRSLDALKAQQQIVAVMTLALLQLFLGAEATGSLLTPTLLTLLALSGAQSKRYGRTLELWYRLILTGLVAGTLSPAALALASGRGYGPLEDYFGYSLYLVIYRFFVYSSLRKLYLSSG